MSRFHVFAHGEAGDFDFSRKPKASTYFILCTVAMPSCAVGEFLLKLRRELAWNDFELGDHFHATCDAQAVRNEVFAAICQHHFTVQATIMEKSKLSRRSARPGRASTKSAGSIISGMGPRH